MNNNLKQVVQNIAEIQIAALQRIYQDPSNLEFVKDLFSEEKNLFRDLVKAKIRYWEDVMVEPTLIKNLSQYQLGICTHILYVMEDEWLRDNPEGVIDCWELFDSLYTSTHPEIKLLNLDVWKRNN